MQRLLVTGGSGYLGRSLVEKALGGWDVVCTYFAHHAVVDGAACVQLDILDEGRVADVFRRFRPHVVIHTAYSEEDLRVVVRGTEHIAAAACDSGARLLHVSTDAVFDGKRGWYREADTPAPVHPYGKAKSEAERFVLGSGRGPESAGPGPSASALSERNAAIVRTSLIWGLSPMDAKTRRLKEFLEGGGSPVLFDDEFRCPIFVEDLAAALLELAGSDFRGVIHVAGPERMSRYEFGVMLAARLGLDASKIIPGSSRDSGLVRPLDCSMDTSLARGLLRTEVASPRVLLGRPL